MRQGSASLQQAIAPLLIRAASLVLTLTTSALHAIAGFAITDATIAAGDLQIVGQVDEPNAAVTLDDSFSETTDPRGRFDFRIAYHPATCTVVLKTERQSRAVVIANCGQRGPAGPPGPPGATEPGRAVAAASSPVSAAQARVSEGAESGIQCGTQAALYEAENGSNVWITRKGRLGQADPLRPLSGQASELVLQASIEGRVVTAYGPSFLHLVRGGSVQELEGQRGAPIAWDTQVSALPPELQTASEDGSGGVTRLRFRRCGTAPSLGREATRKATAQPPNAASTPAFTPAEPGSFGAPSALSTPQGALPEHGAGARAPSAPFALPQASASSAQPVTEKTAPDAQYDRRSDSGISKASGAKLVDINTASVEELNRLGGRFARAIVAGRPYATIDELVSKRVITRATFGQIKDRITAN